MGKPLLGRVKYFPQFELASLSFLLCLDRQLRLPDVSSHITFCFPLILKWLPFSSMRAQSKLKSLLAAAFIKAEASSRASSLPLILWDNKRVEDLVFPLICGADVACLSLDENNMWRCLQMVCVSVLMDIEVSSVLIYCMLRFADWADVWDLFTVSSKMDNQIQRQMDQDIAAALCAWQSMHAALLVSWAFPFLNYTPENYGAWWQNTA